ncbi:hypothetical protein OKS01_17325 [Clostridioides difficile]|nr:hypothetical protein [Clostridioides difficile]
MLKKLRKERGMTQNELAEKRIIVEHIFLIWKIRDTKILIFLQS